MRVFAVVAVVAVVVGAAVLVSGGDDRYELRAVFSDAAGLRENTEVRAGGVPVGTVAKLELNERDEVAALLTIDADAAPVGRDARAVIRSKNLLGGTYVDLDVGDASRPLASGATLRRNRDDAPVRLDDVLAVLDPDTRGRLRIAINEAGAALGGRGGAGLARFLESLPPSLDESARLLSDVAADTRTLERLLVESDRVVGSFAARRGSLGRLVESAQRALGGAASRRRQLGATVREAPGTVAQLERTLARLERTAGPLGPAAAALRRVAPALTGTLHALPPLEPTALRTLAVAREAAPPLTRLADGSAPLVSRLRPTAARLTTFSGALDPVSDTLDRGIDDALGTLEGWARAIQVRDGLGHIFRGQLVLAPELITTLLDRYVRVPEGTRRSGAPWRGAAPRSGPERAPGSAPPEPPRSAPSPPPASRPRLPLVDDVLDGLRVPPGQRADGAGQRPATTSSPNLLDLLLGP